MHSKILSAKWQEFCSGLNISMWAINVTLPINMWSLYVYCSDSGVDGECCNKIRTDYCTLFVGECQLMNWRKMSWITTNSLLIIIHGWQSNLPPLKPPLWDKSIVVSHKKSIISTNQVRCGVSLNSPLVYRRVSAVKTLAMELRLSGINPSKRCIQ